MKDRLTAPLLAAGAAAAGVVGREWLWPAMPPLSRERALAAMPRLGGLICGIFPYYAGCAPGNIALYARGLDYHIVLRARLEEAARALRDAYPAEDFAAYADISPYPEKPAAAMSGLGVIGRNSMLIAPGFGSYVFVGTIATSLQVDGGNELMHCDNCGRCAAACPVGAIGSRGVDSRLCLSAVSQQRGQLSPEQERQIAQNGMAWGCDVCQRVCPLNSNICTTALAEFKTGLIFSLTMEDARLSNRAFEQRFGNRAFAWRGAAPLRRNLLLLDRASVFQGPDKG